MNHKVYQTRWRQSVLDRARTAFYMCSLVVGLGSLWTIAWANSLDTSKPFAEPDRTAAVCPSGSDVILPPAGEAP